MLGYLMFILPTVAGQFKNEYSELEKGSVIRH
jgi:hypothetical protein